MVVFEGFFDQVNFFRTTRRLRGFRIIEFNKSKTSGAGEKGKVVLTCTIPSLFTVHNSSV